MTIETICSGGASSVIYDFLIPITAISSIATGIIIALAYMLGNSINNPKVLLWAKTELIQLFISLAVITLILGIITSFCALDIRSIFSLFPITQSALLPTTTTIYDGAELYLVQGGMWVHEIMASARYHLAGINLLESFGLWRCESPSTDPFTTMLFCLFGNFLGSGGGTGTSVSPHAGYGFFAPALSVAFNTLIFSYLSVLNYLFILRFVYSGFIFFFLPLGLFIRAVPFMRGLGSLMMSVTLCFIFIYPLVLSIFYIDFLSAHILAPEIHQPANSNADPNSNRFWGVGYYATTDVGSKVSVANALDLGGIDNNVFDYNVGLGGDANDRAFETIQLTGNAFLVGVFIPSLALLATLAAISYVNRFLGEDIDLSRIVQVI